ATQGPRVLGSMGQEPPNSGANDHKPTLTESADWTQAAALRGAVRSQGFLARPFGAGRCLSASCLGTRTSLRVSCSNRSYSERSRFSCSEAGPARSGGLLLTGSTVPP